MLDEKFGPYTNFKGSCMTCYGAVNVVSGDYSKVDRYSQWYNIAHASVVVRPEAVRVGTEGYTASGVSYLAFSNPDKSTGVIFLNESATDQQFVFASSAHSVSIKVPAKSVVSAIWND